MLFTEVKNWMQVNNHGLMLAVAVTPYLVLWIMWELMPGYMFPLFREPYNERELRPFWVMYVTPSIIVLHALLVARLPRQTGALRVVTSTLAVLPVCCGFGSDRCSSAALVQIPDLNSAKNRPDP